MENWFSDTDRGDCRGKTNHQIGKLVVFLSHGFDNEYLYTGCWLQNYNNLHLVTDMIRTLVAASLQCNENDVIKLSYCSTVIFFSANGAFQTARAAKKCCKTRKKRERKSRKENPTKSKTVQQRKSRQSK